MSDNQLPDDQSESENEDNAVSGDADIDTNDSILDFFNQFQVLKVENLILGGNFGAGSVIGNQDLVIGRKNSPRIFISYKRMDWDKFVYPLVERLTSEGLSVWVDQHLLEGGDDWMDEINKALKECDFMILCISPEALQSKHVKLEYRYFFNHDKKIFPVVCRAADLPAELLTIQHHPYDKLDDLIAILKKYCLSC